MAQIDYFHINFPTTLVGLFSVLKFYRFKFSCSSRIYGILITNCYSMDQLWQALEGGNYHIWRACRSSPAAGGSPSSIVEHRYFSCQFGSHWMKLLISDKWPWRNTTLNMIVNIFSVRWYLMSLWQLSGWYFSWISKQILSWMMDKFIYWSKPYLLLSATCDELVSWLFEIWMSYHLVSDSNHNTINL